MAKLKYVGPPDMAIVGLPPLVPGEDVEMSDEQAEVLAEHGWFEGGKKRKAKPAEEEESDESP
jgi:hypothetical protein